MTQQKSGAQRGDKAKTDPKSGAGNNSKTTDPRSPQQQQGDSRDGRRHR